MSTEVLNSGDLMSVQRNKINNNFTNVSNTIDSLSNTVNTLDNIIKNPAYTYPPSTTDYNILYCGQDYLPAGLIHNNCVWQVVGTKIYKTNLATLQQSVSADIPGRNIRLFCYGGYAYVVQYLDPNLTIYRYGSGSFIQSLVTLNVGTISSQGTNYNVLDKQNSKYYFGFGSPSTGSNSSQPEYQYNILTNALTATGRRTYASVSDYSSNGAVSYNGFVYARGYSGVAVNKIKMSDLSATTFGVSAYQSVYYIGDKLLLSVMSNNSTNGGSDTLYFVNLESGKIYVGPTISQGILIPQTYGEGIAIIGSSAGSKSMFDQKSVFFWKPEVD